MLRGFEEETGVTPQALLTKPKLSQELTFYYDEYNQLAQDRTTDQGYPCPLTTFQIKTYCEFFNVEDRYTFFHFMRLIDRVYLDLWYKKKKAEGAKK